MSRIFWDTNLFIYLIEDYGKLSERAASIRQRMQERGDQLFTSSLTVGEVLVKPFAEGEEELAERYRYSIASGATIVDFDSEAAVHYARIRQDRTIRPPDAIQLACGASAKVALFITNDDRLSQKTVPGIHFVTSMEKALI
jgi:predicted nucleic acid-binding protein